MGVACSKEANTPTVLKEEKKNSQIQKQIKVEAKTNNLVDLNSLLYDNKEHERNILTFYNAEATTQVKEEMEEAEVKPLVNIAEFSKAETVKESNFGTLRPSGKFIKVESSLEPLVNPKIEKKRTTKFWCKTEKLDNSMMSLAAGENHNLEHIKLKCGQDDNIDNTAFLVPINKKTRTKIIKGNENINEKCVTRSSVKIEKQRHSGLPIKFSSQRTQKIKNSISNRKKTINKLAQHRMTLRNDTISINTKSILSQNVQPQLRLKRLNIDKYLKLRNGSYKIPLYNKNIGEFVKPFTVKVESSSEPEHAHSTTKNLTCDNTPKPSEYRRCTKRLRRERLMQPEVRIKRLDLNAITDQLIEIKTKTVVEEITNEMVPYQNKKKVLNISNSSSNTFENTPNKNNGNRQCTKRLHKEKFMQPEVRLKRLKLDSITDQLTANNPIIVEKSIEGFVEPPIQMKIETWDGETTNEMVLDHAINDVFNVSNSSSTTSSNFLIRSVYSLNPKCLPDDAESSDLNVSNNDIISTDSGYEPDDNLMVLHIALQRASINMMLLHSGYSPAQFNLLNNLDELQIFLDYLLVR